MTVIITVVLLSINTIIIFISSLITHNDKVKSQANKFSAWITNKIDDKEANSNVCIINASDFPMYEVVGTVVLYEIERSKSSNGNDKFHGYKHYPIVFIPPGESELRDIEIDHGMNRQFVVEVCFKDYNGRSWIKNGDGHLKRIKLTPMKYYDMELPPTWIGVC